MFDKRVALLTLFLTTALGLLAGGGYAATPSAVDAVYEKVDPLVSAANQFAQEGNYEGAAQSLGKAIALMAEAGVLIDQVNLLHLRGKIAQDFGDLPAAERDLRQALDLLDRGTAKPQQLRGDLLSTLASILVRRGALEDAKIAGERSLELTRQALGPSDPEVGVRFGMLGFVAIERGEYAEAEKLALQAVALLSPHPAYASYVGMNLNNLGLLKRRRGDLDGDELYFQQALTQYRKAHSPPSRSAETLNNLAVVNEYRGDLLESARFLREALVLQESSGQRNSLAALTTRGNLARILVSQGRYDEAQAVLSEGLSATRRVSGEVYHPQASVFLKQIGRIHRLQGDNEAAVRSYREAHEIRLRLLPPGHPDIAETANDLANALVNIGTPRDLDEAARLYETALASGERVFGVHHRNYAVGLRNLAQLQLQKGETELAAQTAQKSLEIMEQGVGARHPDVASVLSLISDIHIREGNFGRALERSREAVAIIRSSGARLLDNPRVELGNTSARGILEGHLSQLVAFSVASGNQLRELVAESIDVLQWLVTSEAAERLEEAAQRFGATDATLRNLMRQRQEAQARWREANEAFVETFGANDASHRNDAQRLRDEMATAEREIARAETKIGNFYGAFVRYLRPYAVSLDEIQSALDDSEAAVAYLVLPESTFAWVIRRDHASVHIIEAGAADLSRMAERLRLEWDPSGLGVKWRSATGMRESGAAEKMYNVLLRPLEGFLAGSEEIVVLPYGPLGRFPFAALVARAGEDDGSKIRLADCLAVATVPSFPAFVALRRRSAPAAAVEPFLGFGNPRLAGHPVASRLPPLLETADELTRMATGLGGDLKRVFLGEKATEAALRKLPLSHFAVVAFSTHTLSIDREGDVESAIVLTQTGSDDGLLTPAEVTMLDLDADWVILSACSTADSGLGSAEPLSGLASAFLFAGARALLVSHWPVHSIATERLQQLLFEELKKEPRLSRARALQRAMLELKRSPEYAHPGYWAPFVLVGESRRDAPSPRSSEPKSECDFLRN